MIHDNKQWNPIATIPNDGRFVLVTDGNNYDVVNYPPGCAMGKWTKWKVNKKTEWYGMSSNLEPTHWMELPAQPSQED